MKNWNVEFSSALHNRTGKFFIGRDIIDDQSALIDKVYYWRMAASAPPTGMAAKMIGRALSLDQKMAEKNLVPRALRFRPDLPLLHIDPYTVLHTQLNSSDAVLCHDLGPLTHRDLFDASVVELYRNAYERIAHDRPRMIFVSKATADAFARLYGEPSEGRVIYPPLREDLSMQTQAVADTTKPRYLLTVGSVGRRKNQLRAIQAYAKSGLAGRGVDYILCGSREPGSDDVAKLAEATPGVRLLSYISDSELNALYRNASGFVLVSLLEGFGVPVAEAIAQGLVPLVSEKSVLEEVAGDGALLADPLAIDSIATGMVALVDMEKDEADRRRTLLSSSIRRFTRSHFADEWRAMLSETTNRVRSIQ